VRNARAVFASFEAWGPAVGQWLVCTCALVEQCHVRGRSPADVQETQDAFSACCLLLLACASPSAWLSVAAPESEKPGAEAR